jgi:gliding motility associated protien GldN
MHTTMKTRLFFIFLLILIQTVALFSQSTARERIEQRRQRDYNLQVTSKVSSSQLQNLPEEEIISNSRWSRIIYRYLDLTKEANTPLYYPEIPSGESRNLFTHIFHLLENGSIMAYEYLDGREEYTEENKIDWQEFIDRFNIYHDTVNGNILVNDADIPSREVLGYYVKEIYYMEKSTSAFRVKTLAICPILHRIENFDAVSTRYPLFWIPYSEIEPYTRQIPVMASSLNNSLLGTIDDFFQQRRYKGEIYKTGNSRNLLIAQYTSSPEEMKAEQERIEKELTDFERNLTADKSGRISQPTQQQNRSNKRLTLRSQSTPSASQSMRDRRY